LHSLRAPASIELNGSFYALQKPESYSAWLRRHRRIHFSTKAIATSRTFGAARYRRTVANVFASGVLNRGKTGPFLWQFRSFRYDAERVEHFSAAAHDTEQALELARHCDPDGGAQRAGHR